MTTFLQDVRYAFRIMLRNPGVTAIAVVSLALGIGPNAAIFSVIDGIGFRPLAIRDPESLIRLYTGTLTKRRDDTSYDDYIDLRDRCFPEAPFSRSLPVSSAWWWPVGSSGCCPG